MRFIILQEIPFSYFEAKSKKKKLEKKILGIKQLIVSIVIMTWLVKNNIFTV